MTETLTDPKIEIFLKNKCLRLFSNQLLIKEYPIAIGKANTPTPTGNYDIKTKVMYPGGVFGTRWMEFKPRYGIHGTNNPASIGTMASLGCVRMFNHDVEEVFKKVRIGTPVIIINLATIESFFPADIPDNPGQPNSISPNGRTHIVQPGDTLWHIAQRYGVTINQILAINNIPNPNRLYVNQIIAIP